MPNKFFATQFWKTLIFEKIFFEIIFLHKVYSTPILDLSHPYSTPKAMMSDDQPLIIMCFLVITCSRCRPNGNPQYLALV